MTDDIAALWSTELAEGTGQTLQRQLHGSVRRAILSSELMAGTRLPSSRDLAQRLGVARITVTQAYDQLVAEGYIETRHGAGTFVSAQVPDELIALPSDKAGPTSSRADTPEAPMLMSGMPALDQFPTGKWARAAGRTARSLNQSMMYHSDPMGYFPLRASIADYLRSSRKVICTPEQVMIVSGLQQGLFLLAEACLKQDATVIMEDPGYDGMLAAAHATGRKVSYTPVDKEGAVPPEAAHGLLVTSPSRQYPLGHTMPHRRRLELLSWAQKTGSLIFEDDYDSEFRYAGHPLNSLQGIDRGKRVIYGGTFSKSIFPALRLGYLVLPVHLIDKVRRRRLAIDSFPSAPSQQVLHSFMSDGEFARHVRRLRKIHAQRKSMFEQSAADHLQPWLAFQPSDAGLQLLALCKDQLLASDLKDRKLADLAQSCGIGAVPLSHCYQQEKAKQGLLMGFANLKEDEIGPAIQRFAAQLSQQTGFSS